MAFPRHNDQAGPTFFKKLLGLNIFGIVNESLGLVYFYFFGEQSCIEVDGKKTHGPNAVISMLRHYLTMHSNNERHLTIYADNCVGQNKNKFVMGYLAWLVETNVYDTIRVNFMPVGHTKFAPDAFFGTLKREFRRSDIDTPEQFLEMASRINKAKAFLYGQPNAWPWREWRTYVQDRFSAVLGIGKIYHFLLRKQVAPSTVVLEHRTKLADTRSTLVGMKQIARKRKSSDVEEREGLPKELKAMGLSEKRARYLLFQVAQHCLEQNQHDFISILLNYVNPADIEVYRSRRLDPVMGASLF